MKILIVFNQPAPYKVNLFNLLAKDNDIHVIFERKTASNRNKKFYSSNQYNFSHEFFAHGAFGEENSNTGELVKHLKKHHYDLIIMNGYATLTEMRTISYMNKHHIKWSLFINGGLVKKESKLKKRLKTKYISSASNYLSPCKEANEYLIYYGAKEENIFLYPNSTIYDRDLVSKPLNNKEKEVLRKELNLPQGSIIISPCQFISRKNNMKLLEVFKDRKETLLLVGSGVEKEKYLDYIKSNNMNNVIILDYLKSSELNRYYQASNAFITLSKEDIYGHTTNEAMAQGIPVISSNKVVASLHLIRNGENGFIVSPNDTKAINDALDNLNEGMYIHSLETARENTLEKQAKRITKIFKELV
jgi:glycosyltransferase involved in cell wall biosynthesis